MQALDQHQLLDALGKLLNPPPGEEFSSFVTTALREQLEATSVIIGELAPGATEFRFELAIPWNPCRRKSSLKESLKHFWKGNPVHSRKDSCGEPWHH